MSVTPNRSIPSKKCNSSGISKYLLTPCRRVGLSRKIKTPDSLNQRLHSVSTETSKFCATNKQELPEVPVASETVQERCSTLNQTPVFRKKVITRVSSHGNPSISCNKIVNKRNDQNQMLVKSSGKSELEEVAPVKKRKTIARRLSSEDLFDYSESSPTSKLSLKIKATNRETKTKSKLLKKDCKRQLTTFVTQDYLDNDSTPPSECTPPPDLEQLTYKEQEIKKNENVLAPLLNHEKQIIPVETIIPIDTSKLIICEPAPKAKLGKRSLSLKKSVINTDSEDDTLNLKEVQIKLNRLDEDNMKCRIKSTFQINKPKIIYNTDVKTGIPSCEQSDLDWQDSPGNFNNYGNIVSKVKEVAVSSDDDAFTSTPDKEKYDRLILIEQIKETEEEIRINKDKLAKLCQASIYRQKHDPEKLQKLTKVWKDGCISGLTDLLKVLKEHGMTDLNSVPIRLKIPGDIVAKIPKDVLEN